MKRAERVTDIVIALYGLLFIAGMIREVVVPGADFRASDLAFDVLLVGIALPPAVIYFLGVRWCRYVVGVLSILFFLVWCVFPLALPAVDRTAAFWLCWILVFLVLGASSVIPFIRVLQPQQAKRNI